MSAEHVEISTWQAIESTEDVARATAAILFRLYEAKEPTTYAEMLLDVATEDGYEVQDLERLSESLRSIADPCFKVTEHKTDMYFGEVTLLVHGLHLIEDGFMHGVEEYFDRGHEILARRLKKYGVLRMLGVDDSEIEV